MDYWIGGIADQILKFELELRGRGTFTSFRTGFATGNQIEVDASILQYVIARPAKWAVAIPLMKSPPVLAHPPAPNSPVPCGMKCL